MFSDLVQGELGSEFIWNLWKFYKFKLNLQTETFKYLQILIA